MKKSLVTKMMLLPALALPVQGFGAALVVPSDNTVTTAKIVDGAVTSSKLGFTCSTGQILQFNGIAWVCSVGTPGPQGIQGIQGPVGPAGPQGLQGIKGDKGDTGPAGSQGIQGLKGDKGDTGPIGPIGPVGAKGDKGDIGPIGMTGIKGDTGPQGPVGPAPHYSNVIVVAKSGGDFTDLAAAANSISNSNINNSYQIKVMPGRYSVTSTINLKPYVEISGAGSTSTIIDSSANTIINAAEESTITGIALYSAFVSPVIGINATGPVAIKDVVVDLNASDDATGILLTNCTRTTAGTGYINPFIKDSFIRAAGNNSYSPAYGIKAYTSSFDIVNSEIHSSSTGVSSTGLGMVNLIDSKVGGQGYGIWLDGSMFKARNVDVSGWINGVYLGNSATASFVNSDIQWGISSNDSYFSIKGSTVHANMNPVALSINLSPNTSITPSEIQQSFIEGSVSTSNQLFMSNSKFSGSNQGPAALTCIGVYDTNFKPVTCQ